MFGVTARTAVKMHLNNMLRIITYHRIDDPEATPTLDPRLISATPDVFRQHMRFLQSKYNVISLPQLLAAVEDSRILPDRSVLITFDDAYCDFKEKAWPIMKEYDLPATVFVPTAFPGDESRMFWWDRLFSALVSGPASELDIPGFGTVGLTSRTERLHHFSRLRGHVKTLGHEAACRFVEEVCQQAGTEGEERKTVLDWDELRSLAKEGVTLGPHTRTHPIMTQLNRQQVEDEVVGSFNDLRKEMGETLPIFCYPNGSHDDEIVEILRRQGFKLAFTVNDGHNDLMKEDLLKLRRTNITRKSTLPILRLRLQRWFTHIDRIRHR